MEQRIQIEQVSPKAYNGMFVLENYLQASTLTKKLYHLIKIRASQINGCAYCINMHTREAINEGEQIKRIVLLDSWKDSDLFTAEEELALQITEEVTLINENGLSDATYRVAVEQLGEQKLADLIMGITVINAWNRIAISTRKPLD